MYLKELNGEGKGCRGSQEPYIHRLVPQIVKSPVGPFLNSTISKDPQYPLPPSPLPLKTETSKLRPREPAVTPSNSWPSEDKPNGLAEPDPPARSLLQVWPRFEAEDLGVPSRRGFDEAALGKISGLWGCGGTGQVTGTACG